MDRQQAQRVIRETFESSFDKNKFIIFIKNFLKTIENDQFAYQGNLIPDSFKNMSLPIKESENTAMGTTG